MAADRKDIRKKIVFAGQGLFWQTELRQVFTKEGWQTFVWEADKPASEEVIKIHNIPVLVYAFDVALTGEPGIKALQDFLHVLQAGWQAGVMQVYLVSSTLAEPLAEGQRPLSEVAAMAERMGRGWADVTGCGFAIVRLPEVYGPGCRKQDGFLSRALYSLAQGGVVTSRRPGKRAFLYREDAVYGLYRAVARRYTGGTISLAAGEAVRWEELPQLVRQATGKACPLAIDADSAEDYAMGGMAGQKAASELGWRPKYPLAEGLQLTWQYVQAAAADQQRELANTGRRLQWQQRLRRAIPLAENLAGFALMGAVMAFQQGQPVNPIVPFDMNFVYIGAMGLLYGKQQALLAMALSSVLLLDAMLHQGSTLVGLFYVPAMLLHLITYLLVAVLTGYVADSRRYEREAAHWQAAQHEERLAVLKRLYDENMEVKNHLYHQIVNSDDSIGRLYRIIRNLDSVEPENIFTQAAAVTAQVLDVRDIAVYVVGNDQRYLRQKVRLGRLANQLPRSLRVADCRYLQSVLHEKAVYINRELAADAPDMAAPIIHQGRVIAVVEVFGMRFEQWSLHQQNLLSITVRLISSSMGRAYQYESEIQARRYWGNTRILQAKEFDKIIAELKARRQLQGDLPLAMLRVDMTGLDYQELDSRLSGAIRNEDFVGLRADRVYVLLPDADEEVTAMVQRRLQKRGLQTQVDEGIV